MKRLQSLRHLLLALPLLAALLCTSCQRHSAVWPQLLETEALLDTDLPAAAPLLDSLDATPLRGEDAALYAILKTQADYKRYVPLTSDSLPRLATDYYGTPYRKNYHAAMAWYSLGCYYTELKDDVQAIDAYLKAKDCFPDTTIRYYAVTEHRLGKHYLKKQMLHEAQELLAMSEHNFISNGYGNDLPYVCYHEALAYLYSGSYKEAEQLFNRVLDDENTSPFIKGESLLHLAKIAYYNHEDYIEADCYVNRHIAHTDSAYLGVDYYLKGNIQYSLNQYEAAYHYYCQSLKYPNEVSTLCCDYRGLSELAALTGHADSVSSYVSKYAALLDSISEFRRINEIASIQSDHQLELDSQRQAERHRNRLRMEALCALLVCLVIILWGFFHDYQRQKYYTSLCDELKRKQTQKYESLQEELDLCCALFKTTAAYTIMVETASDESHQFNSKSRSVLMHDFDVCFGNLMVKLKVDAPKINDKEFHFLVYSYLGFSVNVISIFLTSAYSTLTSMKTRLKNKMPEEQYHLFFPSK